MEVAERILFLDTETTGLDARAGHRLIEVAAVEAINRKLTGRVFNYLINPERDIDAAATAVHGLTAEDLLSKPRFSEIADEFLEFIRGATVVIHNATFDLSFIDSELARARRPGTKQLELTVIDSLQLARAQFPGKRNSLDALCDRLGVDNTARNVHGALLDSRLLAEVYFGLTRGQAVLGMDEPVAQKSADTSLPAPQPFSGELIALIVPPAAVAAHEAWLKSNSIESGMWR
jgi:DNA polymerase III subunit epsilon